MKVPRYQVTAIEPALRAALIAAGREPWAIVPAFSMSSAWNKFVYQRFGVLKPGPAHYDISLVRP